MLRDIVIVALSAVVSSSFVLAWYLKYRLDKLTNDFRDVLNKLQIITDFMRKSANADIMQNDVLIYILSNLIKDNSPTHDSKGIRE